MEWKLGPAHVGVRQAPELGRFIWSSGYVGESVKGDRFQSGKETIDKEEDKGKKCDTLPKHSILTHPSGGQKVGNSLATVIRNQNQ